MKRIIFSTDGHESPQRYAKRAVTSKQSTVTSEFWTEGQEGRSDEDKIPDRLPRSKKIRDKMQFPDKKKGTDKSNSKTWIEKRIELKLKITINIRDS